MDPKAKVKNDKVALVLLLCAAVELFGLITFVGVVWLNQSEPLPGLHRGEELEVRGHYWALSANDETIVLQVKNTGSTTLSISKITINDTLLNIAYGGNFTGPTDIKYTLEEGDTGTIRISFPFEAGARYEFGLFSANFHKWTYNVTAPTFSSTPPAQTPPAQAPQIVRMPPYELRISHTWGANNANVTLAIRNMGNKTLEVSTVRVNGTVVNAVVYGISFNGTTTHTLEVDLYGSITITYQFSSGLNYEFEVVSTDGYNFPYTVTAP